MNGIAFQDVDEIWWLETIGGHHWMARRVPDVYKRQEEEFLAQLKAEKKGGWACYLHTTKDVPDGMVSVDHKLSLIHI